MESPGLPFLTSVGGFTLQSLMYWLPMLWLTNHQDELPVWIFVHVWWPAILCVPVIGFVGAAAALRQFRNRSRPALALSGLVLNIAFIFVGAIWALSETIHLVT
jgi:hypothetical protein